MKIFSSISSFSRLPATFPSDGKESGREIPLPAPEDDWILWPDSCWLLSDRPLFVPDFDEKFFTLPAIAAKTARVGKCVARRFASRYTGELTAALIILPSAALRTLRSGEAPPQPMLCFDNAVVIGDWQPADPSLTETLRLTLKEERNGDTAGRTVEIGIEEIFPLIAGASRRNTLKTGDVFLHPVPLPPLPVREGDSLSISIPELNACPLLKTRFR